MDEIEQTAPDLYERDTVKLCTAYSWDQLVAMADVDAGTAAMLDRYRQDARKLQHGLKS